MSSKFEYGVASIKDLRDAYHGDFAAAGSAGEVSP